MLMVKKSKYRKLMNEGNMNTKYFVFVLKYEISHWEMYNVHPHFR